MRVREPRIVEAAKRLFRRNHGGKLYCELCEFDFGQTYGRLGDGYIEAHHTEPLGLRDPEGDITRPEDFVMLCSNCHSVLHWRNPWPSLEELQEKYQRRRGLHLR